MGQIQSYATGTPADADYVPYTQDPTGTPVLKNALASALSRVAATHTYSGSSLTGTTAETGTWATDGTIITQSDTAASSHDLLLASATTYSPFMSDFETDLRFTSAAGFTGIATMSNGSFLTAGACIAFAVNAVNVISSGAAILQTITVTAAAGTWHHVRIVRRGPLWSIYLNGAFISDIVWGGGNIGGNGTSLFSQSVVSDFKNVKLTVL